MLLLPDSFIPVKYVHVGTSLGIAKQLSDGHQQSTQTLDFLPLGVVDVAKEFLDTFVHDTLRQHLQLVQFDQTESLSLGLLCGIVFVRVELDPAGCFCSLLDSGILGGFRGSSRNNTILRSPTALEVLLTAVQEILSEKLAAGDELSLRVPDTVVLDVGTGRLHLPAKSRVHFRPRSLVGRLLEDEPDDVDESHPLHRGRAVWWWLMGLGGEETLFGLG